MYKHNNTKRMRCYALIHCLREADTPCNQATYDNIESIDEAKHLGFAKSVVALMKDTQADRDACGS